MEAPLTTTDRVLGADMHEPRVQLGHSRSDQLCTWLQNSDGI